MPGPQLVSAGRGTPTLDLDQARGTTNLDNAAMSFRLAQTKSTARRQISALAAIVLWLTSSWAWAVCCCDTLPARTGVAQSANAVTDWHAVPATHPDTHEHGSDAHADGHPHDNAPAGDCESLTSPHPSLASKASAPPARAGHDFVATAPIIVTLVFLPRTTEGRARWSLPPPPFIQVNPFLSTIRLLL